MGSRPSFLHNTKSPGSVPMGDPTGGSGHLDLATWGEEPVSSDRAGGTEFRYSVGTWSPAGTCHSPVLPVSSESLGSGLSSFLINTPSSVLGRLR